MRCRVVGAEEGNETSRDSNCDMLSSWQSLKTCSWRVCVCVTERERETKSMAQNKCTDCSWGQIQWAVILMRAAKVLRRNQWPASWMFHSLCHRRSIPEYATGHSLLSCSIFVVFARCNLWPHPSCGSIILFLALSSKLQWIALNWTVWLRNLKIQHPPPPPCCFVLSIWCNCSDNALRSDSALAEWVVLGRHFHCFFHQKYLFRQRLRFEAGELIPIQLIWRQSEKNDPLVPHFKDPWIL